MTDFCDNDAKTLLSVDQARNAIAQALSPICETESIELSCALGRINAEALVSPINIPPHRNAAMDGYAFASADLRNQSTTVLSVVGCSWAGKPFTEMVKPGECVRIFTGAVVPEFADSVIPQEQVERHADYIILPITTPIFRNIRGEGSDVSCGTVLVEAGKVLTASDMGLIASAGLSRLKTKRRLRVGFFSTGDELISLGESLEPGQIYDSNRYLLAGLLRHPNHECIDLGVVGDNARQLEQLLSEASKQYDVMISTGGASVGDADFVKQVLEKCGQIHFWKLAIKPGKPLAFGRVGNCWYFGLPGNPVAVSVTYRQFVQPALQWLGGGALERPMRLQARCEQRLRKSPGRQEYQRGLLRQMPDGEFIVSLAGLQESHQQKSASLANCYIVLDATCTGVDAGDLVSVEPFGTNLEL